jgi:DNA-binding transcriptional LysR family regulator
MDIRAVDLNLLVALDVLLSERNVTRAAARLNLSQSAMSAALARLRTVFGDPLLLRTSGGMLPTSKGAELAAPVKQVLEEISRIVQQSEVFDPATATVRFTMAASDYVEFSILPQLVDYLEQHAPHVRLEVQPSDYADIGKQLESGDVDLVVINASNAPGAVRSRPLYAERFVVVARHGHPRLKRMLTLDDFCAVDQVLLARRGHIFAGAVQIDEALAAQGRKRQVRLSVPHFLLVPELVARSDMIAVLPERLARHYADQLQAFDLPLDVPHLTIAAVWHERTHRNPAQAWLRQALADLMQGVANGNSKTAAAASQPHSGH